MPALISNYTLNAPLPWTYPTAAANEYKPVLSNYPYESVVVASNKQASLNTRVFSLLNEFQQLEENWDEEGALKPEGSAIDQAIYVTSMLEKTGQKIFHTAPGPNGEIMMDLRNDQNSRSIEIIFYPNRSVYVTFSPLDESKQGEFALELLPDLFDWLNVPVHG